MSTWARGQNVSDQVYTHVAVTCNLCCSSSSALAYGHVLKPHPPQTFRLLHWLVYSLKYGSELPGQEASREENSSRFVCSARQRGGEQVGGGC